ncbi:MULTISPECIES: MurR/RpiR family transcriptional regulator [unclassified Mesotoga]|uniref:MurR/RpiR family transcriptional regulator n=1 Tax=unclassified Mesotoga TaxID=1184398 RepID=UPI000DA65EF0|nr:MULTISPECIES: MurR/RpiR family transcriptional regulator [unclassified Mesotoga]PZC52118.1 transcriptional regulator [Mesotoga sp. TolDC]
MVSEEIARIKDDLSPAYKRIATYILKEYSQVGFMSIEELSSMAGASKATVVRFSRRLGFSGFNELKKAIQSELRRRLSPYEKIATTDLDRAPIENQLKLLAQNEINNLKNTLSGIEEEIHKWVESIRLARNIYFGGFGATKHVVSLMQYTISVLQKKPTWLLTGSVSDFSFNIKLMDSADVLIVMTFPPYSKEIEYMVDYADERKVRTLLVTDSIECPIYSRAYSVIVCENNSLLFGNSFVGPVAVAEMIGNFIILSEKQTGVEEMKKLFEVEERGYRAMGMEDR